MQNFNFLGLLKIYFFQKMKLFFKVQDFQLNFRSRFSKFLKGKLNFLKFLFLIKLFKFVRLILFFSFNFFVGE